MIPGYGNMSKIQQIDDNDEPNEQMQNSEKFPIESVETIFETSNAATNDSNNDQENDDSMYDILIKITENNADSMKPAAGLQNGVENRFNGDLKNEKPNDEHDNATNDHDNTTDEHEIIVLQDSDVEDFETLTKSDSIQSISNIGNVAENALSDRHEFEMPCYDYENEIEIESTEQVQVSEINTTSGLHRSFADQEQMNPQMNAHDSFNYAAEQNDSNDQVNDTESQEVHELVVAVTENENQLFGVHTNAIINNIRMSHNGAERRILLPPMEFLRNMEYYLTSLEQELQSLRNENGMMNTQIHQQNIQINNMQLELNIRDKALEMNKLSYIRRLKQIQMEFNEQMGIE